MFDLIVIFFVLLYIFIISLLLFGAFKQSSTHSQKQELKLSLIIPAKDEAANIESCLHAILNQNYNLELLDILLMDDASEDETVQIAKKFQEKFPHFRIERVEQNETLVGKSNGMDQGIEKAKHEIIVFCDADCEPNPDWLQTIANEFSDEISVVSGFTLLKTKGAGLFAYLQNIDWIFLLGVGSSTVALNRPISCIGSNLAFRKRSYQEIGGYKSLEFSITEDLSLYKSMAKERKNKFAFPLDAASINWSQAMSSFKDFYKQRKRWVMGSFDLSIFGGFLLTGALAAHLLSIVSFIFFLIHQNSMELLPFLSVFLCDVLLLSFYFYQLKQMKLILFLPIYFIFYLFNSLCIPFIMLFDRNVEWKNRHYNRKGVIH